MRGVFKKAYVLYISSRNKMNKEIEEIIVKFLTNSAKEEDLNKLTNWLKTKDNVHLFDRYIETNYAYNNAGENPNT